MGRLEALRLRVEKRPRLDAKDIVLSLDDKVGGKEERWVKPRGENHFN